jgi:Ca2+-binding RTX toxin-like protein
VQDQGRWPTLLSAARSARRRSCALPPWTSGANVTDAASALLRTAALAAVLGGAVLLPSAPAYAEFGVDTYASVDDGQLSILATAGNANRITVNTSGGYVVVDDAGDTVTAATGCSAVTAHRVRCLGTAITRVVVSAGDLDDEVVYMVDLPTATKGGSGDDKLVGGTGDDSLDGGLGNDTLNGGAGDDSAFATSGDTTDGADTFTGGAGTDTASYAGRDQAVNVSLDGAANDGSAEHDNIMTDVENIEGGSGGDVLEGSDAANEIHGNGGNDIVAGAGGRNELYGEAGDDWLIGGPGVDWLTGGAGADSMVGAAGDDTISGGPGDDDLIGVGGEDWLVGGAGNDWMSGGDQDDYFDGGPGDDLQDGGTGDDLFAGGIEQPSGVSDRDTFAGGPGTRDRMSYDVRESVVTADLDGAADDGAAGEKDNIGTDVEDIYGGLAADTLTASTDGSILHGNAGTDTLRGRGGPDTLYGDSGDDVLYAFDAITGNDSVDGGNGTDRCTTDPGDTRARCEP